MRIAYLIVCLLVLASGALFGALNPARAPIDFYFYTVELRLGLALLLAGLVGATVGGFCVWASMVIPLRARLRRSQRDFEAIRVKETDPKAINGRAELAHEDGTE